MSNWYVYIVECADGTFYTGITTDLPRRLDEHNSGGPRGAKYTRARLPVTLVYQQKLDSRADATKREMEIKRLRKFEKQQLVAR